MTTIQTSQPLGRSRQPSTGARGLSNLPAKEAFEPDACAALSAQLRVHPLYRRLSTQADVRVFMAHHVVCVWDFMSLVKSLQRDICGTEMPWLPARDSLAARFLNEIVLDEESDHIAGRYVSHFDLYLEAMIEVGADTTPMQRLVDALRANTMTDPAEIVAVARAASVPAAATAFLATSLELLAEPLAARVAVFFFGREQAIPPMFSAILSEIEGRGMSCPSLKAYLSRHIDCDGDRHGPMAEALLATSLAGADRALRAQADRAAQLALNARITLWDAIVAEIQAGSASG